MISSVTFETAALADAIKKADKIAPTRGAAFDKAAGIIIEFDPTQPVPLAIIRSTNLNIFSMEWVNVAEWSGEPAHWRLPPVLTAQVIGSLPIGSGKTVTLESEPSGHSFHINLKSGRTKAKFHALDYTYYPQWEAFNPDKMFPVSDLGGRIDQVEWAAGAQLPAVYLDGKNAIATDSYRLACSPLVIPDLDSPILVPSGILGQILRQTGDVHIGFEDDMLLIMPDDHTQIKTVIFDSKYPNVNKVIGLEFDSSLKVSRDALLEIMTRANSFALGDRIASFRIFVGKEEIAIFMRNEEVGQIGDVVEIPGYADHERFEVKFTPKNIMDALSKSPNNDLTIYYNVGQARSIFKIDGGSGYAAWVVPRNETASE